MYILSTKNQVGAHEVDLSSDNPTDPYDIDLVINHELQNNDINRPQPMSGGDSVDFGLVVKTLRVYTGA